MKAVEQWEDNEIPNKNVHFEREINASTQQLISYQNLSTINSFNFQTQSQIHSAPSHDILHHVNTELISSIQY